ncbi:hypothetical protein C5C31_04635 [Rathayibacter rathayi]|nr:hypothetical protein C5C02_00435 [Rathayibacter rathayi]PPG79094.1 hypothetical protein C5C23_01385 [Rathayibacter rathayi]PPH25404.1 hypothetical protein C5C31_04635 [Rathayibacter rathayi]PPI76907.1 hypothetical protein C5E03_07570 [Rathayibacter rathayi]
MRFSESDVPPKESTVRASEMSMELVAGSAGTLESGSSTVSVVASPGTGNGVPAPNRSESDQTYGAGETSTTRWAAEADPAATSDPAATAATLASAAPALIQCFLVFLDTTLADTADFHPSSWWRTDRRRCSPRADR